MYTRSGLGRELGGLAGGRGEDLCVGRWRGGGGGMVVVMRRKRTTRTTRRATASSPHIHPVAPRMTAVSQLLPRPWLPESRFVLLVGMMLRAVEM